MEVEGHVIPCRCLEMVDGGGGLSFFVYFDFHIYHR